MGTFSPSTEQNVTRTYTAEISDKVVVNQIDIDSKKTLICNVQNLDKAIPKNDVLWNITPKLHPDENMMLDIVDNMDNNMAINDYTNTMVNDVQCPYCKTIFPSKHLLRTPLKLR